MAWPPSSWALKPLLALVWISLPAARASYARGMDNRKEDATGYTFRPANLPKTRRAAMRGGQSPVSAVGPLGKFIKTRQEKGGANQNICRIRWRLSPIRPSDGPTMSRQLERHETGCRGIRVPSDLLAVAEGPLVHPQQSLGLYFC